MLYKYKFSKLPKDTLLHAAKDVLYDLDSAIVEHVQYIY